MTTEKTFDPTKPVQTRDGRPVRILDTNGAYGPKGQYPVAAAVPYYCGGYGTSLFYYDANGILGGSEKLKITSRNNLVNVPERKSVFLNVYKNGLLAALHQDSLEAARNSAAYKAKYAILELQIEDEELVNVVIHPVEKPSSQA